MEPKKPDLGCALMQAGCWLMFLPVALFLLAFAWAVLTGD